MNDINNDELHARFNTLRDYDARVEPEFGPLLDHARSARQADVRSVAPALRWVATAASILLVTAFMVEKARHRTDASTATTVAPALSDWQSPTAGLLETRVGALMAPPPVLSSVFDGVTTPLQLKTD